MQHSEVIKRILYVIVLPEESNAILENRNFTKEVEKSAEYANILEAFIHREEERELIVIRPSIDPLHSTGLFGTEISFFITYMGVKLFSPDLVISMGYAGEVALEEGEGNLGIGSVVIAKEKSQYHRREMIIKFYENTSRGLYPVLSCDKLAQEFGYHSHYVGTSNSFVCHDLVAKGKKVRVVEMELCSVARACHYFKIPCVGVKIISDGGAKDLSEEERIKQFLDSLPLLRQTFYDTFDKVNTYLFGKTLSDL